MTSCANPVPPGEVAELFSRRLAGVLLHPTSLPGPGRQGDIGAQAYAFIDFLAASGIKVWQMLPVGPTHADRSPYQTISIHAGSPFLISPELLQLDGLVEAGDLQHAPVSACHNPAVARAASKFLSNRQTPAHRQYEEFRHAQRHWLDDFALYCVLRRKYKGRSWTTWPAPERDRDPSTVQRLRREHAAVIDEVAAEQFIFFEQWRKLRDYAAEKDVLLFGDMPIFVAHDSVDVWANREYFTLDEKGESRVVAGVPPDYFSETGQRWGNPHYDWDRMAADGFSWWVERLRTQLALFDIIRIDHFRGFQAYWEIPAEAETGENGRWVEAPGYELFKVLHDVFPQLPLVAEDLGIITPEVNALRERFGLPGMKILQFAFEGGADNPYLPHNQEKLSVVYTGTHDNNTALGWYQALDPAMQAHVAEYLGHPGEPMPWPLIRAALASVAQLAVVPMQDLLALDGGHRMNLPGVAEGNWRWRFSWDAVDPGLAGKLDGLVRLYGRNQR